MPETTSALELPRYRCHKEVRALKIAGIEIRQDKSAVIAPVDRCFSPFIAPAPWGERFKGTLEDAGYYVVYDDGYTSWSPSEAFQEGYTRIPSTPVGSPITVTRPLKQKRPARAER